MVIALTPRHSLSASRWQSFARGVGCAGWAIGSFWRHIIHNDAQRLTFAKRRVAGAGGVQDTSQAEQVRPVIERLAASLLGDIYGGVPLMTPVRVTLASSTARASPKSVSNARSTELSSRMFDGLTSRCTSPCA